VSGAPLFIKSAYSYEKAIWVMRNDAHLFDPHSYAEETQKKVHQWVNSTDPGGWRHQLNDAPILSFSRTESTPPGQIIPNINPQNPKLILIHT
jgi:hypothetical protein